MKIRRPRPTVFERLMRAATRGAGIRLNPAEVSRVANLGDVWTIAQFDREEAEAAVKLKRAEARGAR